MSSLQQALSEEQQRCADAETEAEALVRKCDCLQMVGKDLEAQVSALALECENLHQAVTLPPPPTPALLSFLWYSHVYLVLISVHLVEGRGMP